jgi:hypothetical protein
LSDQQQSTIDRFKAWAFWLAFVAAIVGWGRDFVSDRFRVENRLTRIEAKVDQVGDAVQMIADQGERITRCEEKNASQDSRLERLERN